MGDSGTTYHRSVCGRHLAWNTVLNLLGHLLPLIAAIATIPPIIRGLGPERFGVLSLVWMVIGYFGLFDFGIGRATTKFAAEYLARGSREQLRDMIWSSIGSITALGIVGGGVIAALNRLLVEKVLDVPASFHLETEGAFYALAVSIPFVLASSSLRGILEAHRRFAVINAVKIPVGVASVVSPLLVLQISDSLAHVAMGLLTCRVLELAAYLLSCSGILYRLGLPRLPRKQLIQRLAGYGGWVTLSNLVVPLMTYLDRFIVGGILSISAVAYYSTPYDVVTKQAILPASLLAVVFPAMSGCAATDRNRLANLYESTLFRVIALMAPPAIVLSVFADPLLNAWLGPEFASHSAPVVRLLALGVLLNGMAQVPYAAIQALGKPCLAAKLHLVELPFFLCLLWVCVSEMGIIGAALAWVIRVAADAVMLVFLCCRQVPPARLKLGGHLSLYAGAGAAVIFSGFLGSSAMVGDLAKLFWTVSACTAVMALFLRLSHNRDVLPEIARSHEGAVSTVQGAAR